MVFPEKLKIIINKLEEKGLKFTILDEEGLLIYSNIPTNKNINTLLALISGFVKQLDFILGQLTPEYILFKSNKKYLIIKKSNLIIIIEEK